MRGRREMKKGYGRRGTCIIIEEEGSRKRRSELARVPHGFSIIRAGGKGKLNNNKQLWMDIFLLNKGIHKVDLITLLSCFDY